MRSHRGRGGGLFPHGAAHVGGNHRVDSDRGQEQRGQAKRADQEGVEPRAGEWSFEQLKSWHGPSLIIAYSHCIAHGYDMAYGAEQQKLAVDSGVWPLYRFDPRRVLAGQPPLVLDSAPPKISPRQYMRNEARFQMVEKLDPERFKRLLALAEKSSAQRFAVYQQLAGLTIPNPDAAEPDLPVPPVPVRS
jgi:hypothetical protein